jgi:hypothetical protein
MKNRRQMLTHRRLVDGARSEQDARVRMRCLEPQNASELFDWLADVSGGELEISRQKPFNKPLDPAQEIPLTQEGIAQFLREYVWQQGGFKNCEDAIHELALCFANSFAKPHPHRHRLVSLTEHTKSGFGIAQPRTTQQIAPI